MKKKQLPQWISSRFVQRALQSSAGVYFSYWVFQGMLYMGSAEVIVKLGIDALLTIALWKALGMSPIMAFLIAHTSNMIFNGHLIALRRHAGLGRTRPDRFIDYIEALSLRISRSRSIDGAAAFGSLSRNIFRPTSDIDIRYVPCSGRLAAFKASLFAVTERTRAFLACFPLDLYVFSLAELDTKMNPKEAPILFHDPTGILREKYSGTVSVADFIAAFRKSYVQEK